MSTLTPLRITLPRKKQKALAKLLGADNEKIDVVYIDESSVIVAYRRNGALRLSRLPAIYVFGFGKNGNMLKWL